jgi:hypothetical protein
MNLMKLMAVGMLLSGACAAQQQLPLAIGNIWEYTPDDPGIGILRMEVMSDTSLVNGQTYFVLAGSVFFSPFLRTDGSRIYAYDVVDTLDYLLFDFHGSSGDTMATLDGGTRFIMLRSVDSISQTRSWMFTLYMGFPGSYYDFANWWITDSLGVTAMLVEPGNSWGLSGARIAGDTIGHLTAVKGLTVQIPHDPYLESVYPNPFNPATIRFVLPKEGSAVVDVLNVLGQSVETIFSDRAPSGPTEVRWNGMGRASGVYFVRLRSEGVVQTKKVVLLR